VNTVREEAITQLLHARLCSDVRTCGQSIDIVVENDHVELVGTCDSEEQRAAALMIVLGTHGVRDVQDRLQVRRVVLAAYRSSS
jgi:osmotically-inducible protein OsmY